MKLTKVSMAVVVAATLTFASCKPKDGDIQAKIEEAIKANPSFAGATVAVKDGIATVSGEVKDTALTSIVAAIKGVKSVVNTTTLPAPVVTTPPPATPEANAADPKLQDAVKAIIKDIPGVTIGGFSDKGVALNGEISKANNMKLKQALAAAKINYDAAGSKLTVK